MTSAKDSKNGVLKQGTLAFSSAKRASSNTTAKAKKAPQARRSSSTIGKEKGRVDDARAVGADDILELSSEELSPAPDIAAKPSRTAAQKKAIPDDTDVSISHSAKKRKEDPPAIKPVEQRQNLDVAAKRYREHYGRVREKMGNLEPIHAEGQNKIHEILRVFDMSYEYGPCVGMTRLERWERAASFGLNPPEEVRDILLTREGVDMDEYSQCVLYGEV